MDSFNASYQGLPLWSLRDIDKPCIFLVAGPRYIGKTTFVLRSLVSLVKPHHIVAMIHETEKNDYENCLTCCDRIFEYSNGHDVSMPLKEMVNYFQSDEFESIQHLKKMIVINDVNGSAQFYLDVTHAVKNYRRWNAHVVIVVQDLHQVMKKCIRMPLGIDFVIAFRHTSVVEMRSYLADRFAAVRDLIHGLSFHRVLVIKSLVDPETNKNIFKCYQYDTHGTIRNTCGTWCHLKSKLNLHGNFNMIQYFCEAIQEENLSPFQCHSVLWEHRLKACPHFPILHDEHFQYNFSIWTNTLRSANLRVIHVKKDMWEMHSYYEWLTHVQVYFEWLTTPLLFMIVDYCFGTIVF